MRSGILPSGLIPLFSRFFFVLTLTYYYTIQHAVTLIKGRQNFSVCMNNAIIIFA
jgi:hypothetical protein